MIGGHSRGIGGLQEHERRLAVNAAEDEEGVDPIRIDDQVGRVREGVGQN